jgi:hypothetical protein
MAGAHATEQPQFGMAPKKGVLRLLRENPYILGLSMVIIMSSESSEGATINLA